MIPRRNLTAMMATSIPTIDSIGNLPEVLGPECLLVGLECTVVSPSQVQVTTSGEVTYCPVGVCVGVAYLASSVMRYLGVVGSGRSGGDITYPAACLQHLCQ